jgi:hypothetical protein
VLKELTFIDRWLEESKAEGITQGAAVEARKVAVRMLRARFGEPPPNLLQLVEQASTSWCEELLERMITGASLEELTEWADSSQAKR